MSPDSLCRWQVQLYVYCAWRIPVHLRCTQRSILLHLIDICFLQCICLWQISQIQTCLCVDITRFYEEQRLPSIGSAWPACPKNGKSGGGFDTICTAVYIRCDSYTTCRLRRWETFFLLISNVPDAIIDTKL